MGAMTGSALAPMFLHPRQYGGINLERAYWVELSTHIHNCGVLVFKCLNNLIPEYLSGYFVRNSNIHSYNA